MKSTCIFRSLAVALAFLTGSVQSFAPLSSQSRTFRSTVVPSTDATGSFAVDHMPAALQRQRRSVAPVQTMGLFGLGAPEIAVVLVAAAFLLGPQKLAELGKDAGKIAGELKEVPKEFQKGLEEGEESAKIMKSEIVDVKKESEEKKE